MGTKTLSFFYFIVFSLFFLNGIYSAADSSGGDGDGDGGTDVVVMAEPANDKPKTTNAVKGVSLKDLKLLPPIAIPEPPPDFRCGLITNVKEKPVSLQVIDIQTEVFGFFADVSTNLTYTNANEDPLEVSFVFPLDSKSALYRMQSHCDKTIIGKIFEKEKAQKKYDDAISAGQQASLVTEDENHSDVLTMKLGNIKPGQTCWIEFSFVQELEVVAKEPKLKFVYPIILGDRYTPDSMDKPDVTNVTPKLNAEDIPYEFKFSVVVVEPEKVTITPLGSNLMYDATENSVSVQPKQVITETFGAIIDHEPPLKPNAVIEAGLSGSPLKKTESTDGEAYDFSTFLNDTVVMVNFLPDVSNMPLIEDQEYIIILDRSGSMGGQRIKKAREAVSKFLSLLPDSKKCLFNVISFGSSFEPLYQEDQMCTKDNIADAKTKVEAFDADFGGTEILEPLKDLFSKRPVYKQRQIFLLTDGEVSNTRDVIAEVGKNFEENRFYTFGIGMGASTELVNGIASFGGKSKMLTDDDDLAFEVQKALEACQSVFFWDVRLQISLSDGLSYDIVSMDHTISNEPFQVFFVVRGEALDPSNPILGEAILLAKTWKKKEGGGKKDFDESSVNFDMALKIDKTNTHPSLPIHRMAAKKLILQLTNKDKLKNNPWDSDEKYTDTGKKVLKISEASNVVSPVTSFLAIDPDAEVKGDLKKEDTPVTAEAWNVQPTASKSFRGFMPGPMPMPMAAANSYSYAAAPAMPMMAFDAAMDYADAAPAPPLMPMVNGGGYGGGFSAGGASRPMPMPVPAPAPAPFPPMNGALPPTHGNPMPPPPPPIFPGGMPVPPKTESESFEINFSNKVDNNFSENVEININSNNYDDKISYSKNINNQTSQDVNIGYDDKKDKTNDQNFYKNINFSKNVDNNSTQNINMNIKRSDKNPKNQKNNEILDVLENKMLEALDHKSEMTKQMDSKTSDTSASGEIIKPNKNVNNQNTGENQKMFSDSDNSIDSPEKTSKDSVVADASNTNPPLLVETTLLPNNNIPVVFTPSIISTLPIENRPLLEPPSTLIDEPKTPIDIQDSNSISSGVNSGSIEEKSEEVKYIPQETQIPKRNSKSKKNDVPSSINSQTTPIPLNYDDSEIKSHSASSDYSTSSETGAITSENKQSEAENKQNDVPSSINFQPTPIPFNDAEVKSHSAWSDYSTSSESGAITSENRQSGFENRQTDKIPHTSLQPKDSFYSDEAVNSKVRCPKYNPEKVQYQQTLMYPNMRCAPRHGEDKLSSRMYNLSELRINQIKLEDEVYSIITLSNGCGAVDCADPFSEPKCGGWYAYNKLTRECECVSQKVGNGQCIPEVSPGWNVYKIRKKNILAKAHVNGGNLAEEEGGSMTFAQLVDNAIQDTFFWAFMINIALLTIASGFYNHYYGCCSSKRKETDYHLNENLMMTDDVIYAA